MSLCRKNPDAKFVDRAPSDYPRLARSDSSPIDPSVRNQKTFFERTALPVLLWLMALPILAALIIVLRIERLLEGGFNDPF